MVKVLSLENMMLDNNVTDVSSNACFPDLEDYNFEKNIKKLAKSININPEILNMYSKWVKIDSKYYFFKSHYVFEELLINQIFKSTNIETINHQIVLFDGELGLMSENFRKPKSKYYFYDELVKNTSERIDFIASNNILKTTMNKEDYENYLQTIFKIIAIDILFGQYDRWEQNVIFEKDKNKVKLAPMFDNGCIFDSDYGEILLYQSCFGSFSFSLIYEDYYTTEILQKYPLLTTCINDAINIDLNNIFNELELEYKIKIYKEIRKEIQAYYDKHRKIVDRCLKFL